ncbi:MAG: ribonuclease [Lachnospiraceae bacterium]|nr:ribonuclease [Lachnospiraceae bacterium]
MKRKRFSILLIFLSVLTLLFSGCDIDSFAYINPDGSTVEYNTHSGSVTYNTPEENGAVSDEEDISDDVATDEDNQDGGIEDIAEDTTEDDSDKLSEDSLNGDSESGNGALEEITEPEDEDLTVSEDGEYTSKDEVALYIHLYNHLPSNYITKKEAQDLGWDASQGKHLNKVAPGKSIGGDKFGNREGLLPKKDGRVYYECDIDYKKGSRNAKRIVFSNDGLIYYTEDHYETYELLYE